MCGLGTKPPIETVQRMSREPVAARPALMTSCARRAICSYVLVGLGGQAAHEVELHVPPAVGVRGDDGTDEVLLGHHLVDHPADTLRAALGREREPGAAAVARQLLGEGDVEGVDAGRGQRERDVGALVLLGQPGADVADLGVVGAGQREQPYLGEAGELQSIAGPSDRPW